MPTTYEPIATQTLISTATSVTFSSIPQTYTDLFLVTQMRLTTGPNLIFLRFNGDTGNNYSVTRIYGTGSSALSDRYANQSGIDCAYVRNSDWNIANHSIQNYSNTTTTNKTTVGRWGDSAYTFAMIGLWRNTSAITSISLTPNASDTFVSGSIFTLYGIKAA
jgi:hypothetical protein